jgi:hypothetical protein
MLESNVINVSASEIQQVKPLTASAFTVIYKSGFFVEAIEIKFVGSRILIYQPAN